MARNPFNKKPGTGLSVVVIGLGRFGSSVALSLTRQGVDVLGVDEDPRLVSRWADDLTHVVQADSTDDDALEQLGIKHFSQAVVAIGTDVEASVITTLSLVELGIPDVWVKALSRKHGAILDKIGAHHVIYPEAVVGEQVAGLMTGTMGETMSFEGGHVISRTYAPREAWGRSLAEVAFRRRYGVTVVGLKRRGEHFTYATAETRMVEHDELVVAGEALAVEKFSTLP